MHREVAMATPGVLINSLSLSLSVAQRETVSLCGKRQSLSVVQRETETETLLESTRQRREGVMAHPVNQWMHASSSTYDMQHPVNQSVNQSHSARSSVIVTEPLLTPLGPTARAGANWQDARGRAEATAQGDCGVAFSVVACRRRWVSKCRGAGHALGPVEVLVDC